MLTVQAAAGSRKLYEVENSQDKALKEAKVSASRHQSEAEELRQRLAEAESEKAELRKDHATEATGFTATKRELEVRLKANFHKFEMLTPGYGVSLAHAPQAVTCAAVKHSFCV